MTKRGNRMAAFAAVTCCPLHMIDVGLIARCNGLAVADVEAMVQQRREREAAHG